MDIIFLITGLLIGIVAGGLIIKFYYQGRIAAKEEHTRITGAQISSLETELRDARDKNENLNIDLASAKTELQNMQQKLDEQKEDLDKLQKKFILEFENLANKILEEKTQKFTDQNKTQLTELLDPLKDKIKTFEQKVEDTYIKGTRERSALKEQIQQMMQLNEKMSEEANNLTKALKGDSKTQGNWGEVILERILESSGLAKGREYELQESVTNEEGKRLQPDVIILLPDDKHIIIDAKVSLTHYEQYVSADKDAEREKFMKLHIASIRNHIKGLSQKDYTQLYDLPSLDFVLMFIPIEPAFALSLQHEPGLFKDAFDRNIILVSSSTLLATLRTISSIWKHEYQSRYALEIASQGGKLYDKFSNFVDDLIEVGKKMDAGKREYEKAMNKLVDGRGNLVRQAEKLKELGVKATKSVNSKITERAMESGSGHLELDFENEN
jgi:DNA recombination protein RmuC